MEREIELVRRAANGDGSAFADLYRRNSRAVFLDLVARLRFREDAEDALQSAFASAWKNLPGLRRPERFRPWLFRIARNKALDTARRPRPVAIGGGEDLIGAADGESGGGADLRRLVAGLKPDTRSLVLLRAVEGMSAGEVGTVLGMSASTVRRRYARAVEHLRSALSGGEDE